MNITIINDCQDANESGRQTARVSSLFQAPSHVIGVKNYNELEAAGNLVDVLDAYEDRRGVILVNSAPRHRLDKKYSNGTPFGYFRYKNVLVVSTIAGLTLSLVKKLGLVESIQVLDIEKSLSKIVPDKELRGYIVNTQFRSYDFVPRAAHYLLHHDHLPSEKLSLVNVSDAPQAVWWVDSFGNCKTTLLEKEESVSTLPFYKRLADVPDGKPAIIIGSSGINIRRFLEIVVQGKRATDIFGLKVGDKI